MRLRDQPTVEVSARLALEAGRAWDLVTDITLPTRAAGELQSASWDVGHDAVVPGARFRGHNSSDDLGEWTTSCEVVDVRSLSPVDYGPILDSVRSTGRMVYAQEAPGHTSVGGEIAATVMERAFYALEAPVLRVSGFDAPFPPAKLEGT